MRIAMESDGRAPTAALVAIMLHPAGDRAIFLLYHGARREDEARVRADLLGIFRSLRAD